MEKSKNLCKQGTSTDLLLHKKICKSLEGAKKDYEKLVKAYEGKIFSKLSTDELCTKINGTMIYIAETTLEKYLLRECIMKKIKMLSYPESEMLTRRYIFLEPMDKIAQQMGYSYDRARHICKNGLNKYGKGGKINEE